MKFLRPVLLVAACLVLSSALAPLATAAAPVYLTSTITQSGAKQATINGYDGVLVTYTSAYSGSLDAFVYVSLANQAGQIVYWNVASCSFSGEQKVSCFVTFSPSIPPGTYTANAFATTSNKVPISSTTSLAVSL